MQALLADITEVNAIARSHLHFEVVPGLAASCAVPTYAGLPLGTSATVCDEPSGNPA